MSRKVGEPRPDAVEHETPHRSRKKTRKWCKGKVGVEHQLVVEVWPAMNSIGGPGYDRRCRWLTNYYYKATTDIRWHCKHCLRCTVCRKILDVRVEPKDCPEYRQMPPGPYLCVDCGHVYGEHGRTYQESCHCGCRRFHWVDPTLPVKS